MLSLYPLCSPPSAQRSHRYRRNHHHGQRRERRNHRRHGGEAHREREEDAHSHYWTKYYTSHNALCRTPWHILWLSGSTIQDSQSTIVDIYFFLTYFSPSLWVKISLEILYVCKTLTFMQMSDWHQCKKSSVLRTHISCLDLSFCCWFCLTHVHYLQQ